MPSVACVIVAHDHLCWKWQTIPTPNTSLLRATLVRVPYQCPFRRRSYIFLFAATHTSPLPAEIATECPSASPAAYAANARTSHMARGYEVIQRVPSVSSGSCRPRQLPTHGLPRSLRGENTWSAGYLDTGSSPNAQRHMTRRNTTA